MFSDMTVDVFVQVISCSLTSNT